MPRKAMILEVPEKMREVVAYFAAAVCEKPDKWSAAFAILVKQCGRDGIGDDGTDTLRLLVDADPRDIATTLIAYLPAAAGDMVKSKLRNEPDAMRAILTTIRQSQVDLREAVRELVAEKGYHQLRKVTAA